MRSLKFSFIVLSILSLSAVFTACSEGIMGQRWSYGENVITAGWKWYVNQKYTIYSRTSTNSDVVIANGNVGLPFFEKIGPAGYDLYRLNPQDVDMYPEDGWVLVSVNFGALNEAPVIPYFILYNKVTGTLRYFFYYLSHENFTHAAIILEQHDGLTLMFTFYDSVKCFMDDYFFDKTLVTITPISHGHWSYADFVLEYDPAVSESQDVFFKIKVYGINQSEVVLDDETCLSEIIGNGQMHSSGFLYNDELLSRDHRALCYYKSVDRFIADIVQSSGAWYSKILNTIGSTFLISENFESNIELLSRIISSGIFGSKKSQPVALNFADAPKLKDSIAAKNFIDQVILNIPGSNCSNFNASDCIYYTKPLGIFCIQSKPVVDITIKTDESSNEGINSFNLSAVCIKVKNDSFPELYYNNIDGYSIDKIELGFVFSDESLIHFKLWSAPYEGTYEDEIFRVHADYPIIFRNIEEFKNVCLNYSEEFKRNWYQHYQKDNDLYNITESDRMDYIQQVGQFVAPEIAIKLTIYSVKDVKREKPLIHLKRVRTNYNLYRYESGKTTYLGFFNN